MKAVWSFWPKPAKEGHGSRWPSEKHHFLSWILSVMEASKHYGAETELVTDDEGAATLVDGLGLKFTNVSTALNRLRGSDSSWWALGKIVAYRQQTRPFVHLDNDVILWSRLPDELENADVLAQNPEFFRVGDPGEWYIPEQLERLVAGSDGWLPREWRWYRSVFSNFSSAICCGIYGGNRLDFIQYCADLALKIVEHPMNAPAFMSTDNISKSRYLMLIEQFLPMACIEYHMDNPFSDFKNIRPRFLFHCMQDAYCRAFRVGYTHLISDSKSHPFAMERLESRVRAGYPELYDRCCRFLSKRSS